MRALPKPTKLTVRYLRSVTFRLAVFLFVAALFLGGVYGVMTIIEVLFYGHGLSFFMVRLNRTVWRRWGIEDKRNDLSRNSRHKVSTGGPTNG